MDQFFFKSINKWPLLKFRVQLLLRIRFLRRREKEFTHSWDTNIFYYNIICFIFYINVLT